MINPEPRVPITIELTPEEHKKIQNDAAWAGISSVSEYMRLMALGWTRRGC